LRVDILFADSRLDLIEDSLNRQTRWAIGTSSGGESVSSDAC
jgi:hypothetical protein